MSYYIDPQKFYSSSEVIEMGKNQYFPVKSRTTLQRLITQGKLVPVNVQVGQMPRYFFKGETLLTFLDTHGTLPIRLPGGEMVQMVRQESDGQTSFISKEYPPSSH